MIDTVTITEVYACDPDSGKCLEYRDFRCQEYAYDWRWEQEHQGREVHVNTYSVGECPCGDTLHLLEMTNECDNCGLLFNPFGQEVRY